jgi:hypothetical protein
MYVYIDDKNFWLDFGCFPEKIYSLKKCKQIKLKINLYIDINNLPISSFNFDERLDFLKSLEKLPETIYVSKSDYYWWCFDRCQLIYKKVYQDKDYYDYQGRDIKKWNIELTISYEDVWGSNKKVVLERDLKLKKLFND